MCTIMDTKVRKYVLILFLSAALPYGRGTVRTLVEVFEHIFGDSTYILMVYF